MDKTFYYLMGEKGKGKTNIAFISSNRIGKKWVYSNEKKSLFNRIRNFFRGWK